MTTAEEYRLLGFTDADTEDAERFEADPAVVEEVAQELRREIGTFAGEDPNRPKLPDDPRITVAAFLKTLPDIRRYHQQRGISDEISWATLADLGQQLDVHRRTHGEYGLETHWWMSIHWSGVIYALGRLQFLLHQPRKPVPGVEPGEWILGVHIPEIGPLTPEAVDDSFQQAREFFPRHFPEYPVKTANLGSWLIDPYLLDNLPPESNLVRFGRRFTPYGEPQDSQESAVYFTFRTRDLDNLDQLPRDTRLQRLVIDRIKSGGTWQNATGYLKL